MASKTDEDALIAQARLVIAIKRIERRQKRTNVGLFLLAILVVGIEALRVAAPLTGLLPAFLLNAEGTALWMKPELKGGAVFLADGRGRSALKGSVDERGVHLDLIDLTKRDRFLSLSLDERGPSLTYSNSSIGWRSSWQLSPDGPLSIVEREEAGVWKKVDPSPASTMVAKSPPLTPLSDQRAASPGPIRATSLEIVDEKGNVRARCGVDQDRSVLSLLTADSKPALELSAAANGAGIRLGQEHGSARAAIEIKGDQGAFRLDDAKGNTRAEIRCAGPSTESTLRDAAGNPRWSAIVTDQRERLVLSAPGGSRSFEIDDDSIGPLLSLSDRNGQRRAAIAVANDGFASILSFLDGSGTTRTSLGVEGDGTSTTLHFYDDEGKMRAGIGVESEQSFLGLSDTEGQPRAVVGVDGKAPSLALYDASRRRVGWLALEEDGPTLAFADKEGHPRVVLNSTVDGNSTALSFLNADAKLKALLGVNNDKPNLLFWNAQGHLAHRTP